MKSLTTTFLTLTYFSASSVLLTTQYIEPAWADVGVCNERAERALVAVAYREESRGTISFSSTNTTVRGWFTIEPGSCKSFWTGDARNYPVNKGIYFHPFNLSLLAGTDGPFCVDTRDAFEFINSGCGGNNSNHKFVGFYRMISLGSTGAGRGGRVGYDLYWRLCPSGHTIGTPSPCPRG